MGRKGEMRGVFNLFFLMSLTFLLFSFINCKIAVARFRVKSQKAKEEERQLKLRILQEIASKTGDYYKFLTFPSQQKLYNITVEMKQFPPNSILAGPIRNHSITHLWFDFHTTQLRKPAKYVYSEYNHTGQKITFRPPSCGTIPSMTCLSEMLNVSRRNNTGEENCGNFTTFNPMFFNVPRWNTKLYVGPSKVNVDSQTIYFLGLAALLLRYAQRNCTRSFYLVNAMSRNIFRVPKYINSTKLKNTMRKLKRKQAPVKPISKKSRVSTTTPYSSYTSTIFNVSTNVTYSPIVPTRIPTSTIGYRPDENFMKSILTTQLKDLATWVYTTLRYRDEPFCKPNRNRTAVSEFMKNTHVLIRNETPYTIYGTLDMSSLYYNDTMPVENETASDNNKTTPTSPSTRFQRTFIDPLWDYLDSLLFLSEIRNFSLQSSTYGNLTPPEHRRAVNLSTLNSLWWWLQ
ncbi:envelope glycoprotein O [Human betaherpesvirus 5]|uniref:Envelope glycoprotein O n=16 Tax=Human cytomegalovirus TaxID=10359 RepID=D2IGH0_HCMV|nr:envelope glycoprotein O [Human betaherpesvirus 5]ACS93214.1 envelope glycoprotein O [Human betaherpesvirus 5]AFR56061.1 envelope glycoprotein O [Human betaherpesvirus 5]AKI08289.1 envelope glycoprotein O [Human betaherpesvirus 5]AKI21663.1 envelope glycoprotein O [Human betaherpesvirus 5]